MLRYLATLPEAASLEAMVVLNNTRHHDAEAIKKAVTDKHIVLDMSCYIGLHKDLLENLTAVIIIDRGPNKVENDVERVYADAKSAIAACKDNKLKKYQATACSVEYIINNNTESEEMKMLYNSRPILIQKMQEKINEQAAKQ